MIKWTRPPPSISHTASDQKLDSGKAWKQGYAKMRSCVHSVGTPSVSWTVTVHIADTRAPVTDSRRADKSCWSVSHACNREVRLECINMQVYCKRNSFVCMTRKVQRVLTVCSWEASRLVSPLEAYKLAYFVRFVVSLILHICLWRSSLVVWLC